jgi:hypothetical protein
MSEGVGWENMGVAGVQHVKGWPCYETEPRVQPGDDGWIWTIGLGYGQHKAASEQEAKCAALEAALALAKRIEQAAGAELRRIKQAAQDVEDAALVATLGGEVWTVRDATFAQVHTAQIEGHHCRVEVYKDGHTQWELEPEYYGHPYTWDAPDVETAKIRAAAAALRDPCKRWRVTIPAQHKLRGGRTKGGTVEVWAVTQEGAMYRAGQALEVVMLGDAPLEGEAVEIEGGAR